MRLTTQQRNAIREEVSRIFGDEAIVRLFGSRVDDSLRGGDIDLHIESEGTPTQLLDRELQLHARLMRRLGDRHIDIITHNRQQPRPIDTEARSTGVLL